MFFVWFDGYLKGFGRYFEKLFALCASLSIEFISKTFSWGVEIEISSCQKANMIDMGVQIGGKAAIDKITTSLSMMSIWQII
jgi:hypothetical protein